MHQSGSGPDDHVLSSHCDHESEEPPAACRSCDPSCGGLACSPGLCRAPRHIARHRMARRQLRKALAAGADRFLERVIQTNLSRISEAMKLFRSWAETKGLLASETAYVGRAPHRPILQFSRSGHPTIERLYRTHWLSPALSERERERLVEKASRPPDLVVIQPLNTEWTCYRCGGSGDLLMMEPPGPACLRCVGLDDLESSLRRAMRCSAGAPRPIARDLGLSSAAVEAVIAMNIAVCWSSGRLWLTRSARSRIAKERLPDASRSAKSGMILHRATYPPPMGGGGVGFGCGGRI